MPHYDFEDTKTGEAVELWFEMSKAPRIGEKIRHEGRRLRRVVSSPQARVEGEYRFKCWQVSGEEAKGAKNYDTDGCPVFSSKREIQDFLRAKHEAGVTSAEYGDGWGSVKP